MAIVSKVGDFLFGGAIKFAKEPTLKNAPGAAFDVATTVFPVGKVFKAGKYVVKAAAPTVTKVPLLGKLVTSGTQAFKGLFTRSSGNIIAKSTAQKGVKAAASVSKTKVAAAAAAGAGAAGLGQFIKSGAKKGLAAAGIGAGVGAAAYGVGAGLNAGAPVFSEEARDQQKFLATLALNKEQLVEANKTQRTRVYGVIVGLIGAGVIGYALVRK